MPAAAIHANWSALGMDTPPSAAITMLSTSAPTSMAPNKARRGPSARPLKRPQKSAPPKVSAANRPQRPALMAGTREESWAWFGTVCPVRVVPG